MKEQGKRRRAKATAAAGGDDAKTVVDPDRTRLDRTDPGPASFSSLPALQGPFLDSPAVSPQMDKTSVERPHLDAAAAATSAKVATAESFRQTSSQTAAVMVFWGASV